MNCYNVIRNRIEDLIAKLRAVQCYRGNRLFFHKARQRFNAIKLDTSIECDVEKAALLIYLNKTCFNGLYRVNRLGNFNVPWGRYKRPRILDETNLRAVNTVLNRPGIQLTHGDYTQSTQSARKRDFVYFDPPYQPLSRTASFTSYTENTFELKDQMRLAKLFQDLDSRDCLLMLSNSPRAESLFAGHGYRIERVKAARAINSVGSRRGPVNEILVMNY
jgi:DNA adenine methylase